MTNEEIIAVVSAHIEGKQIQQRSKGSKEWHDTEKPNWNFYVLDYRVKPENKYRTFMNTEEIGKEISEHGGFVTNGSGCIWLISFADEDGVCLKDVHDAYSYKDLVETFVWLDTKTPCGILE